MSAPAPSPPTVVDAEPRQGIRYIEAWLRGIGAVAVFDLMEDAATAEISRSRIRQWIDAGVVLDNGRRAAAEPAREVAAGEPAAVRAGTGEEAFAGGTWQQAHDLPLKASLDEDYADFLALPAYEQLKG